jgi:hypothetical protein
VHTAAAICPFGEGSGCSPAGQQYCGQAAGGTVANGPGIGLLLLLVVIARLQAASPYQPMGRRNCSIDHKYP